METLMNANDANSDKRITALRKYSNIYRLMGLSLLVICTILYVLTKYPLRVIFDIKYGVEYYWIAVYLWGVATSLVLPIAFNHGKKCAYRYGGGDNSRNICSNKVYAKLFTKNIIFGIIILLFVAFLAILNIDVISNTKARYIFIVYIWGTVTTYNSLPRAFQLGFDSIASIESRQC